MLGRSRIIFSPCLFHRTYTKLSGDFHSHMKSAKFPVPQLPGTTLLEQLLIQKCPADAQNCSLTVLVLCLCRAGGVSLHTLQETGDKSSTIQWHLDATGFWLITIHSTKPLLHVLRVVTLIQGSFSTQILASKMSFGFAEITHLNYVLFSGRKKYKPGLSHSASLACRFCTGYTATVLQRFTHHSQFYFFKTKALVQPKLTMKSQSI